MFAMRLSADPPDELTGTRRSALVERICIAMIASGFVAAVLMMIMILR